VPTTGSEWRDVITVAGIASLAAMLVGALAGGVLGERWHAKLVTRALDPRIGAEAEARRDAELRAAEAEERRTGSFQRVRAATPSRTRRVDAEETGTSEVVPMARVAPADGDGHDEREVTDVRNGDDGHDGHDGNWAFWRRRPAGTAVRR